VISLQARPSVVAALSRRLLDVERALASPAAVPGVCPEGAADSEETLRELMVRHLPHALSMDTPDRRSRVCALLLGLAGEACGSDVRFLDAFNAWFERVDASWHADREWQQVKIAYANALREAIVRLQSTPAGTGWSSLTADTAPARANHPAMPQNARVLILADHWAAAFRILREMRGVGGLTVHTLICNNAAKSVPAFGLRQAFVALMTGVRGVLVLLVASWQGRVHVSGRPLHDEATLRWLRTERFWIGLHAMGVIYREPVFASFGRGILNAHIGLLPEFRGRSVMEWSILTGAPAGVTVFFMDSGIDTGREIVLRRSFDVRGAAGSIAAKASLFRRDGQMYRAALQTLLDGRAVVEPVNDGGRRYFVMSGLLTTVVDGLIESAASDTTWETQACTSLA
jgi:hypothetical protein